MKIKSIFFFLVAFLVTTSTMSYADKNKKYTWRLAETWGPNFPIFGDAAKNMAKMVNDMSDGRLTIRIDSSNKHKSPLGIFDFVKTGQYTFETPNM